MEFTKEVMLLFDEFRTDNTTCDEFHLIKLTQDIIAGLTIAHTEEDKEFWKYKIAFQLLNRVLLNEKELINMSLTSFDLSHITSAISWSTFFNVALQSCVFNQVADLLFSSASNSVLLLFCEKYCHHLQCKLSNQEDVKEFIASFPSLAVNLYIAANGKEHFETISSMLEKCLKTMSSCCQTLHNDLNGFLKYHVSNITDAITKLQCFIGGKQSEIGNSSDSINVLGLNSLQNDLLAASNSTDQVEILTQFSKRNTLKDCNIKPVTSMSQDVYELLKEMSAFYVQLVSDDTCNLQEKKESDNDYVFFELLHQFIKDVDFVLHFDTREEKYCTNNNDVAKLEKRWNLNSALFTATNLLKEYDEAANFLLVFLNDEQSGMEHILECVTSLNRSPVCFYKTGHIKVLYQILLSFIHRQQHKNCTESMQSLSASINGLRSLMMKCFHHMPLDSKIQMLEEVLRNKELHKNLTDAFDELSSKSTGMHQRRVTTIFNTLTKADAGDDLINNLLHEICEVSFVDSHSTLQKIIDQVIYHEEHHESLCNVLCHLPFLLRLTDKEDKNLFLSKILTFEQNDTSNEDATFTNITNFLVLMFSGLQSNSDLLNLLVADLFHSNIMGVLSRLNIPSNEETLQNGLTSLDFSLKLLCEIFAEKLQTLDFLSSFDLCTLVFLLAKKVDCKCFGDDLMTRLKKALLHFVEVASTRLLNQANDVKSVLFWFQNVSCSLHWTTQLYLYPILSQVENFQVTLPTSIEAVCEFQNKSKFHFVDCYGEGTGLVAWLQCLVVDPGILPLGSLATHDLSAEDRQFFTYGMVLALTQFLPFCLEDDWFIIIETIKGLIHGKYLQVPYPTERVRCLPFVNMRKCLVPLSVMELLHRVTLMLSHVVHCSWMKATHWIRFAKCYSIVVKELNSRCDLSDNTNDVEEKIFMLYQLFMFSCDFLILLESVECCNNSQACNSVFVLLLDLLKTLYKISENVGNTSMENPESGFHCDQVKCEILGLKPHLLALVETILNDQMEEVLVQKIIDLV